jgi:hypothetical protein
MIQRNANLTQNNLHKIKLPEELYGHLLSSVVRHPPQLEKEPTCENSFIFIFTILQKKYGLQNVLQIYTSTVASFVGWSL